MKTNINERVTVTSMGFRKDLITYPRRIEFQGKTYNFMDSGLRCLIRRGEKIAEILTLSDGNENFWLRRDVDNGWTLLGIAASNKNLLV